MNPQFNIEALRKVLESVGVKYVFLGKELGARPEDKSCYRDGQVQYALLAQTSLFKRGIERIESGSSAFRIALLCAEKEPLNCHRTILVARKLREDGVAVQHILSDGRLEEHDHTLRRLIAALKIPEADMFRSAEAVVEDAYTRQGEQIAYREPSDETAIQDTTARDGRWGSAK